MPEKDMVSWVTMIDGYAKSGDVLAARRLFDEMPRRDVISCNSMMAGYVQNGYCVEALKIFHDMKRAANVFPDDTTLLIVLTAFAQLGHVEDGVVIHHYLMKKGYSLNGKLGVALIDMYSKCGSIENAVSVFENVEQKCVDHWNALIGGLAIHGMGEMAFDFLMEMGRVSVIPDDITFIGVLSACRHAGMLKEGMICFEIMQKVYKLEPKVQHYGCMVDLLSRAGHVEEARKLIEEMPVEPNDVIWKALLSACQIYENFSIGKPIAQQLTQLYSCSPSSYVKIVQSHDGKTHLLTSQRSHRRRRLDKKFTRFLNNMTNVYGQVNESLAISNAVELFKLVFLSTSSGPQPPNLLADILRRYSEHDLFAAFNYLREKKIMVGGTGNERFELSQQFLQSVLKSPFPFNTGKQAVKFSAWLEERGKDLIEVGANISEDLQCGDIFHLFALVSSGDISILPCLPDNGIGEAEDLRNAKRKYDVIESSYGDKVKKPKSFFGVEGEIISRREKGFPGIAVSAYRTTISKVDILNLFKDNDNYGQPFGGDLQLSISQTSDYSVSDHIFEIGKSCEPIPLEENHTESPWEAMAGYSRLLLSEFSNPEHAYGICAEVFRVVYAAIQKAGDQGLSMGEISKVINLPGAEVHGSIVDALQAFGLTLKVNAYDTVRVIDVVYRHKYFLTSGSAFHHLVQPSSTKAIEESDHTSEIYKSNKRDTSSIHTPSERTTIDNVHTVTILNLPREDVDPENQASDRNESCKQDRLGLSRVDHEKETLQFSLGESCVPILPWINGDGTINNIVYRGLRRRVLGIVMQNPGMLEDDIIRHMDVLNPQNCRTLLEMMVLDKHLTVRKMLQNIFDGGPTLLQGLIGSTSSQPKLICREHFFANPMSTALL